ncbi:peptidylprolyl isomerase [Desulfuribacillus alkaliarsenatis]|uniref:peptidylprolyl isomerase n=1 Tax=Desulfuribacillus alkaliarsenatis TaxID=766136 RepID=A0A1E5FYZ3_9FIRM|nr:peptidyl-prolyl cis-trans isomerase [Desulfuribacillus alkaliarsenatis]OEF95792.1 hypothetical protein BHF68_11900 [Desulfuribacillus alkaliarsenatis]
MREKILWGVIAALILVLVFILFFQQAAGDTMARVEQRTIYKDEFMNDLLKKYGPQHIYKMIEREAVYFEANRLAIEVSDREVDKEIDRYRSNFVDSNQDFEAVLFYDYGITLEQLREDIRYNILLEKLATLDIRVTEAEMEKYYEENIFHFREPEKLRISRILLHELEDANRVYNELVEGANFAAIAMEVSQDRLTSANGGDMGYISVESIYIDYEIIDTAMGTDIGDYSQPFQSYDGWNIIMLENRIPEKIYDYSEVKSFIHRELALKQAKPLHEYLQDLVSKLDIEIYEQTVKKYLYFVEE